MNSDRKTSLAVAVKSLLVRNMNEGILSRRALFQPTSRPVPVNGLLRSDDGSGFGAVHPEPTPMESHLFQWVVVYFGEQLKAFLASAHGLLFG